MSANQHDNYRTGHHEIDHHHEELFFLDQSLDRAIRSCRRSEINDIIVFLEHYVNDHFKEEEVLMETHQYGEQDYHTQEHQKFRRVVTQLREQYDQHQSTTHIIFSIRKILDQLTHHIRTVDTGLGSIS